MKNSLFDSAASRRRLNFNPEGFDLAQALRDKKAAKIAKELALEEQARKFAADMKTGQISPDMSSAQKSDIYSGHLKAFADQLPVELVDYTSVTERELVIRAAYQQVFGNAHLMESEKSPEAESQLCSGQITVMEFVRQLAKSERYRTLFFDSCTNIRAIELNFKHLLGRAPESAEISQHIAILADGGFEAEIDSYLDSDEYFQNFGTNIVPYYRGYNSQTGKGVAGYTHSFNLVRGASSSDKSTSGDFAPQLQDALLENRPTQIQPLTTSPPTQESILSSLKALEPVETENTFKDLEIRSIGAPASAEPTTTVSPRAWAQEFQARKAAATFPAARLSQPVTLSGDVSAEDLDSLINSAYKQVFGNAYLMESERLVSAETKLKQGQISVKGFISELAKSDRYRSLFLNGCTNVRAVELNFKHLLGRAPDNAQEVSKHIQILVEQGFTAEINSYLNSEEYNQNFGDNTVPYYISYSTQTGKNVAGYNRIFELNRSLSSSDRSVNDSSTSGQGSKLQSALFGKAQVKQPVVFNPDGFDLAKRLRFIGGSYEERVEYFNVPDPYKSTSSAYTKAFSDQDKVELIAGNSVSQQDLVIKAAYKQVFGNAYLMESERSPLLESKLRNGEITVMEFVRQLAKSDRYRTLFFDRCSNLRAIELNFKHLLGRAPESAQEISQHIQIIAEGGFEAEIDSYLNSDEYFQNFGTNIVPYYRGYQSQVGKNMAGYTHSFQLLRGASSSDKSTTNSTDGKLNEVILQNLPSSIKEIDSGAQTDRTSDTKANSNGASTQPLSSYPTDPLDIIRRAVGLR